MRRAGKFPAVALCLLLLGAAQPARAQQIYESVGSRALGMGGAFVAVANDGTASFWNPAGIALAPKGSVDLEWASFQTGNQNALPAPGPTKRTGTFASLGSTNFNLSYANLESADLAPGPGGPTVAEVLQMSQYGATLLQALSKSVIVGTTLKLVRGFAGSTTNLGSSGSIALSNAEQLQGPTVTRFDFDVGLMVNLNKVRVGVSGKNLEEPSFPEPGGTPFVLYRQVRTGVAVLPTRGLTLAMDVDLDTVDLRDGHRRMIAIGGEDRLGTRFALRGGVRWSVIGDRQLAGSFGLSLALKPNAWIDGHYTQGDLTGDRGFGLAFRAGS